MCGIFGMVALDGSHTLRYPELLSTMGGMLRHRGPDATGTRTSPVAAFGVERLRVRDRRAEADQPFVDEQERWLVCNGEVYNATDLRRQFAGFAYRSLSDVEPLIPLLRARGVSGLSHVDGMFALAWWDPTCRSLVLARDRAGEKPLFYLEVDGEIWFASEVQALTIHPRFSVSIDDVALTDYLTFGYVREPRTLFQQIRKVPAGAYLHFGPNGAAAGTVDFPALPEQHGSVDPEADTVRLRRLLEHAVVKQTDADVPVGVFLSGGLDSSLVTMLAARTIGSDRLLTFAVRFPDRSFDESRYARRLSESIGLRHVSTVADTPALQRALTTITQRVGEPVADPAILPTFILADRAKQDVGVVLSGEGADELFGGYPTYLGHRWAHRCRGLPASIQGLTRAVLRKPATSLGRVPLAMLADRFFDGLNVGLAERHVTWFGTGLFQYLPAPHRERIEASLDPVGDDHTAWAMDLDFRTYLREGLLVKLDRATMLVSLEARAPFLDAAVIAFARRLPTQRKVSAVRGKLILREIGREVLPGWILRRRKHGLSVPIGAWINEELRDEVDRLLGPQRLQHEALDGLPVDRLLTEHRARVANHARALWALITLQLWFQHWGLGEGNESR